MISQKTRNLVIGLALAGLSLVLLSCSRSTAEPVEVVVTVPVVETRVVEVTREVEKTVVVTATPVPTPCVCVQGQRGVGRPGLPDRQRAGQPGPAGGGRRGQHAGGSAALRRAV